MNNEDLNLFAVDPVSGRPAAAGCLFHGGFLVVRLARPAGSLILHGRMIQSFVNFIMQIRRK